MTKWFDDRVPTTHGRRSADTEAANTTETGAHASCITPINLLLAYSISACLATPTVSPAASITSINDRLHWLAIGGKARCALASVGAARINGSEPAADVAACEAGDGDEALIRHCTSNRPGSCRSLDRISSWIRRFVLASFAAVAEAGEEEEEDFLPDVGGAKSARQFHVASSSSSTVARAVTEAGGWSAWRGIWLALTTTEVFTRLPFRRTIK